MPVQNFLPIQIIDVGIFHWTIDVLVVLHEMSGNQPKWKPPGFKIGADADVPKKEGLKWPLEAGSESESMPDFTAEMNMFTTWFPIHDTNMGVDFFIKLTPLTPVLD